MAGACSSSLPPKLYLLFQFLQWWASQLFRVKPAKNKTTPPKTENKEGGVKKGPHNSTMNRVHNPTRKHTLLKNCRKKLVGQELEVQSLSWGVGSTEQASDMFKLSWQGEDMQVGGKQALSGCKWGRAKSLAEFQPSSPREGGISPGSLQGRKIGALSGYLAGQ